MANRPRRENNRYRPADKSMRGGVWAVGQNPQTAILTRIAPDGTLIKTLQQAGEILSIWPARNDIQAQAFSILAGFKDDTLRAFSEDGGELWNVKTLIHPSFIIGDRYDSLGSATHAPLQHDRRLLDTGWRLMGKGEGRNRDRTPMYGGVPFSRRQSECPGPDPLGKQYSPCTAAETQWKSKKPLLLAGKVYTGNPQLSGINQLYANESISCTVLLPRLHPDARLVATGVGRTSGSGHRR